MALPRKRSRRPVLKLTGEPPIPSEFQECQAFYQYTQTVLRLGKRVIHHANEGQRTPWYGKALKSIGLTPGVLDYQFLIRCGAYIGLWIEMKRRDGRNKKKDADQEEFMAILREVGFYADYAYGFDDALLIYNNYINGLL